MLSVPTVESLLFPGGNSMDRCRISESHLDYSENLGKGEFKPDRTSATGSTAPDFWFLFSHSRTIGRGSPLLCASFLWTVHCKKRCPLCSSRAGRRRPWMSTNLGHANVHYPGDWTPLALSWYWGESVRSSPIWMSQFTVCTRLKTIFSTVFS